ncbi:hypothetical protein GGR51DRAFT_512812 [Nemania sp. FL0031]|nr:hypothetical protein GGR51DRAFT_512812 [Nemania sp. FL0031]
MEEGYYFDLTLWQCHETEDDVSLIFRTTNGRIFYCHLDPTQFIRSPKATEEYFKCINLCRSDEEELDGFYVEDAWAWFSNAFEPLIHELAPSTLTLDHRPTLSDYLFAPYFVCTLDAVDEEMNPRRLDTQDHGWGAPFVRADQQNLDNLRQWTRLYQPSEVELCYDNHKTVLIQPPSRVTVSSDDTQVTFFFKAFGRTFSRQHAMKELDTLKKIAAAQFPPPPEVRVCRLHGVVQAEEGLAGMLFSWIDVKAFLSRGLAEDSPVELRIRWREQIKATLEWLHKCEIIWGDAKAENILIDKENNAWVIDFGGSYTPGWVDEEKAGTVEGDMQGFKKIMEILN